jgi:hypothetical protein
MMWMEAGWTYFSIRMYGLRNTTQFLLSWEEADWMHVAQNRDKWRGLMHTLMNLLVIIWREFPNYLSNYQLVKKGCAPIIILMEYSTTWQIIEAIISHIRRRNAVAYTY